MIKFVPIWTKSVAAGLALALGLAPGADPHADAQDAVPVNAETVGKRIDLAGRQRMLSERMAKFFCYARSGVDPIENLERFNAARALFDRTHEGMIRGDAELGLFAEDNTEVSKALRQVGMMWTALDAGYLQALTSELVTEDDFEFLMLTTLEVRKRANDAVAQLRAAYSDELGDRGFGNALLIDLYGRQRMLSQKLSKEVCLVSRGFDLTNTVPELQATLKLFEDSLTAFREGLSVAGVPKPPTPEIAAQLKLAHDEWEPVRLVAATMASGGAVSLSDLSRFAIGMDRFLVEMNKAVVMLASLEETGS